MNEQITKLQKQIEKAYYKIQGIQEMCHHPKEFVEYVHCSNTGNYDPSCDRYWTEYHCLECDKKWHQEGSGSKGSIRKQGRAY